MDDKISRFGTREDQYPVNNWLNDIFCARIIVANDEIKSVMEVLDDWQDELNLKIGICGIKKVIVVYTSISKTKVTFTFRGVANMDEQDLQSNIRNHEKFKRNFYVSR